MLSGVTTPQDLDERFRAELAGLATEPGGEVSRGGAVPRQNS
jgi:hypothetical protein